MKSLIKYSLLLCLTVLCVACSFSAERSSADYQTALDLIDRGVLHLEGGFHEQAYAAFEVAFEKYPSAAALDGLGCVELHRGNLKEARIFFEQAHETNPEYHKALAHMAMIDEIEGRSVRARQLYEKYLSLAPDDVRVRNNYAAFLYDQQEVATTEKARQELLRANSIDSLALIQDNFNIVER